jgi:hypothetical protein
LWNNTGLRGSQLSLRKGDILISYSDVEGGSDGVYVDEGTLNWLEGNIDADPYFVNPNNDDYHLKSQAGRWDPYSLSWISDAVTSPCIDKGDSGSDWMGELWPHGKRINMGAFGGTPEASMSLLSIGNIADLNNDGCVDYKDKMLFVDRWLYEAVLLPEDLDRNGFVNFTDSAIFANNWRLPSVQASNPQPANHAKDIDVTVDLSWTAGPYAESHDVCFGTSRPPPFACNQTVTTFDAGIMAPATKYYWRIGEVNSSGKTIAPLWSFTTVVPP